MDITGARWGLDTVQAVLTLRAVATTGDLVIGVAAAAGIYSRRGVGQGGRR